MASPYLWGFLCKELIEESPFIIIADNLPTFSAGSWFCGL
jgi:hypothetical protein